MFEQEARRGTEKKIYFSTQLPQAEQMSPWQPKLAMKLEFYCGNSNNTKPPQASRYHHSSASDRNMRDPSTSATLKTHNDNPSPLQLMV